MKKLVLYICLLSGGLSAQVNLVLDPGFEVHGNCNNKLWIEGCRYWHSLDSSNNVITSPTLCTPTYANMCATDANASLPDNYVTGSLSHKYPRTGNGMYITLLYYDPVLSPGHNRWYLRGKLKQKLSVGESYCGKYYVSLYKTSMYATDRCGAYLDNGNLDQNNACVPVVVNPYFENPAFHYMTDTVSWTKIEGVFTANGTEEFITIGNFYSHTNTHKTVFNPVGLRQDTYYYVDDVSIIPFGTEAFAGNDVTLCVGDSIELGRPQEAGLECLWYTETDPVPFSYTSNFLFRANRTGTFSFIQKMDNCRVSFDTVNVTVVDDCKPLQIPNTFSPNEDGVNDTWHLNVSGATELSYVIYNRWGNLIRQSEVNSHRVVIWDGRTTAGEPAPEGLYYYILEYSSRNGERRRHNGYITLFR